MIIKACACDENVAFRSSSNLQGFHSVDVQSGNWQRDQQHADEICVVVLSLSGRLYEVV